jgi:hypothetical protein
MALELGLPTLKETHTVEEAESLHLGLLFKQRWLVMRVRVSVVGLQHKFVRLGY